MQAALLDYLNEKAEESLTPDTHGPLGRIQIIATTHSPNLASSVDIENMVVLRTAQQVEQETTDEGEERAVTRRMTRALALRKLSLKPDAFRKINQYLDATRVAMLFARHRIILVEGVAEAVLLPVLARERVFAGDRDKQRQFHAVTIVNVGSVGFEPYIRLLLGPVDGLTMVDSLVVITDGDPSLTADDEPDDSPPPNRADRLQRIAAELGAADKLKVAEATYTLEADLLAEPANTGVVRAAYLKQHRKSAEKIDQIIGQANRAEALYRKLRTDKKFISKGEFAHDVALYIRDGRPFTVPPYLRTAITSVLALSGEADDAARAD